MDKNFEIGGCRRRQLKQKSIGVHLRGLGQRFRLDTDATKERCMKALQVDNHETTGEV